MKTRYVVGLVYTKNIISNFIDELKISLRTVMLSASSEGEALGNAIMELEEEMKGYTIQCKTVTPIPELTNTPNP